MTAQPSRPPMPAGRRLAGQEWPDFRRDRCDLNSQRLACHR